MTIVFGEGVCLLGRFRLSHCIGEGGMGVVWSATNTNTLRRVALKMLKADTATDPRARKRFLREARAASAVRHSNVVEILDVVELEDGSPAMVMELLEGESLGQRLRQRKRLELGEVAAVMLPALSAVGAAHALGIVHRDLKPDNIFLARGADGQPTVKVLDFGIAKVSALDHEAGATEMVTGTGTMLGTPYYMSPEQVFADAVIDYRSDIWAFGVILYQCLAGVRPTQAENVGQIMKIIMTGALVPLEMVVPDLPAEITLLVGKMLSSAREARPQSLKDVCEVLQAHSTVKIPAFGDPVFVNVGARDHSSGSGEVAGEIVPAPRTLIDPPESRSSGEAATRSEGRLRQSPPGSSDSLQTASTVHTVPGGPPSVIPGRAAPGRWRLLAATVALMVAGGVVVARLGAGPAAVVSSVGASPSASSSAPPMTPRTETPASSVFAAFEPSTGAASSSAPAASVAISADPSTRARRVAPRTTPSASPAPSPAASAHVSSPGGLVEKPPF